MTIKPSNKAFYEYYNEAMKCWLFDLYNSAIIICSTFVENILHDWVDELDPEKIFSILGSGTPKAIAVSFNNMTYLAAKLGIISNECKEKINRIRKTRNTIVHRSYIIEQKETLELIHLSKEIVEEILNKS